MWKWSERATALSTGLLDATSATALAACWRMDASDRLERTASGKRSALESTFILRIGFVGTYCFSLLVKSMGLDTVELVMDVEDHFGVLLREDDSQRIRTIGDLADTILARILAVSSTPCPTMRTFYELRSTIRGSLGNPGLRIRPSTRLSDLISPSQRRICWDSIRAVQPWRFPRLDLSDSAYVSMFIGVVFLYLAPFILLPLDKWIFTIPVSSLMAIIWYSLMNRFRTEIPKPYITIGDLVRSSIGSVIATKKTELRTRDQVLAELLPIVSEQFGVDIEKLHPTTRFFEDLAT